MDNLELWYRANIKQTTLSEQPPITFKANGEPLADWTIYGAQGGVGERTENLFYKQIPSANISANGVVVSVTGYNLNIAAVTAGETYSFSNFVGGGVYGFFSDELAIGSVTYNSSRQLLLVEYGQITIPAGTSYVAFRSLSATENLMLNQGGTVSPYEPYGYKIPIICGGETTNIYIGENQIEEGESVSYAETGVEIPTNQGTNTLTVNTNVQPSMVSVTTSGAVPEGLRKYLQCKYDVQRGAAN